MRLSVQLYAALHNTNHDLLS